MKVKLFIFSIALFFAVIRVNAQSNHIIPAPVSFQSTDGYFTIDYSTYFQAGDFRSYLDAFTANDLYIKFLDLPIKTATKPMGTGNKILVGYDSTLNIPDGGYILHVGPDEITITGKNKGGVYYGLMSLLQMIETAGNKTHRVACCNIEDYPRFQYRGMHLDCARHFFEVDFVKKYIDYLALYKMNTFHWHLTDDQGWRIEIKQYPKLTSVGAWRSGTMDGAYRDQKYDTIPYGGFYTQKEIREIVKYASDRNITVIPEFEMPGHSVAALAAYPEFGCIDTTLQVERGWGGFDDIFCPKEETFTFIENILDEIMDLFPSTYIHVGGDEVSKTRWEQSAFCQQLIIDSNLVDENGLQSYFMKKIERYINSKGRKMIGWDEILDGGIAPNATIMSWRGEDGGIAAAQQGHDAIMTPGGYCYLDHYQGFPLMEPLAIGGFTPLEKVYNYEPVPAALTPEQAKHILGAQGNIWTEYIHYPDHVEYMMMPRMIALSEVVWSPAANKNYDDFIRRLLLHFPLLDKVHCNYSKSMYQVNYKIEPAQKFEGLEVNLMAESLLGNINVVTYNSVSGKKSSFQYSDPFIINDSIKWVTAQIEDNKQSLPVTNIQFNFNKATGKKITLKTLPSKKYSADGPVTLVNGITGTTVPSWSGSEWLGFSGTDLDATIDLGQKDTISSVTAGFLTDKISWIYPPQSLEVFISEGGRNFTSVGKINFDTNNLARTENTVYFDKVATRYVRIVAVNYGTIPSGNQGAGFKAWLFADEISIR